MRIASLVKSLALEAGFHAVGITSAEPFEESEHALRERYESGLLEGTGFDPETIRLYTHPRESFPAARSIIAVALSYLTDPSDRTDEGSRPATPLGRVARFARGLDYHQVLQQKLAALAEAIRSRLGGHVEIGACADTGPLVDRSAAIRAGIGSRGKNTCVYICPPWQGGPASGPRACGHAAGIPTLNPGPSPSEGEGSTVPLYLRGTGLPAEGVLSAGGCSSWVVLGELVTDLELEPDAPARLDICGECDECVRACPTGAISAPYVLDVRICLSQTTQMKGYIPGKLREKLGNRIYGCDTCQEACPLNRDARPGNVDAFRPSAGLGSSPELLPLLNIGSREFKARIRPTTAGWIGRTTFRRNVAVALGNIGDPVAIPGLIEALSDPEPIIRAHSAWALGRIGGSAARRALKEALKKEDDDAAKWEIKCSLAVSSVVAKGNHNTWSSK